ncbi:MAG: B12-binding domain-containing radical SAM protein [Muribaculaceae bacterium]|nr:B12-binding domain-containing radical SAM protein [Muribaculaceae bacterium]
MKLTFIVPPCFDHKQPAERTAGCTRVVYLAPNIYELSVAAVLEQNKADEVRYRDFVYHSTTPEQFAGFFAGDDSDVYLIWCVNLSITTDLSAIEVIRRHRPEVKIVLMGPGPTHFIKRCLPDANVFVVRGEPEATVQELIEAFRSGAPVADIKGVSWLDAEGKVVNNPPRPLIKDLDALPFAARHLLGDAVYHNPKLKTTPYVTMITSRNCPYRCIYCVPSSLTFAREIEFDREHGRKPTIGFRSPENVEREVAMLASQGVKAIGFMDDNFIWNEERTAAICDIMRRYGMVWGCQARADAITGPIAEMLGRSGCRYVDIGVESFDEGILKYIRKGETAADIYRAIELLKKYKVPVKLNVLIGSSPLETRETVLHTLRETKKLGVDQVMFNIVSPFPGTEYYKICKENGWLATDDYVPTDVQRESILNLPHLSAKEMEQLLFRNNLRYFLSFRFIARQLGRFRSLSELRHAMKALKIKLFG